MLDIADQAGVRLVNRDRMRHDTEGIQNWNPVRRTVGHSLARCFSLKSHRPVWLRTAPHQSSSA
jgi:predicted oxidoreductase